MPRFANRPGHDARRRNVDMIGQRQMPQHNRAAAYRAMGPDGGAARHADAARHGRVLSNMDVMADLYQVVELDAVLDDGIVQRTTVDAGIGADLNIVANAHRAELLDFFPGTGVGGETKSVGTNDHAGVQETAVTDAAVFAHGHARLEHGMRANAGTALDHAQGANAGQRMNKSRRVDHRAGMHLRPSGLR